jgi:hypothetical protein
MTAIFERHPLSETLGADELEDVTGAKTADAQRAWLDLNMWKYRTNPDGRPVVGRMYARIQRYGFNVPWIAP